MEIHASIPMRLCPVSRQPPIIYRYWSWGVIFLAVSGLVGSSNSSAIEHLSWRSGPGGHLALGKLPLISVSVHK